MRIVDIIPTRKAFRVVSVEKRIIFSSFLLAKVFRFSFVRFNPKRNKDNQPMIKKIIV